MALSNPTRSDLQNCRLFPFAGSTQSMNDHSLYINSSEESFTTLLAYMDDIILVGNK